MNMTRPTQQESSEAVQKRESDTASPRENIFQVHQLYSDYRFTNCHSRQPEPSQLDCGSHKDLYGERHCRPEPPVRPDKDKPEPPVLPDKDKPIPPEVKPDKLPLPNPNDKTLNTHLDNMNANFEVTPAAREALNDKPNPIAMVQLEHHLPTDAVWVDSRKSLEDMPKMKALSQAFQATRDEKYADKTKEFMLSWATHNKSFGNPINDEQLLPLVHAYGLVKDSAAIKNDPAAKNTIENYMRDISTQNQITYDHPKNGPQVNWQAHRVEIMGDIAFALGDKNLISKSLDNFKTYVGNGSITADGSTVDFTLRDAIYYHNYAINPMLRLAEVAVRNGYPNLFHWEAPNGASLAKAVDFEVPYVTGEKRHMEFVNSTIEHDRNRANAGLKTYMPHYWDPQKSKRFFENAKALDPSYARYDKYFD